MREMLPLDVALQNRQDVIALACGFLALEWESTVALGRLRRRLDMADEGTSRPKFSNPDLDQVVQHLAPAIETFKDNLDSMSADIKQLESYLQSSPIRIREEFEFGTSGVLTGTWGKIENHSGPVFSLVESVAWEHAADKSTWRLMYRKIRHDGKAEYHGGFPSEGPIYHQSAPVDVRPLIETAIPDRIRGYRALPGLMKKLGEAIRIQKTRFPWER
jgi:hypothetical protein